MISLTNNKFRNIPEDTLVLSLIETARPSVALEVAYLSGKKKVIEAVQARIAKFRIGRYSPETYESDRQFYTKLTVFKEVRHFEYLAVKNGELVLASKASSKMLGPIANKLEAIFFRLKKIEFKTSKGVSDILEQKKSIETFERVRFNLELLFNNTIRKSNVLLFKRINNHLSYTAPELYLEPSTVRLNKNEDLNISMNIPSGDILIIVQKSVVSLSLGKNHCELRPIKEAKPIHFLVARVFAELFYTHPNPKALNFDISKEYRPLFYAVGLIPFNERAERRYQEALKSGEAFSKSSKGLSTNCVISSEVDSPQTGEKREKVLKDPLLKIVDHEIYKYLVFSS